MFPELHSQSGDSGERGRAKVLFQSENPQPRAAEGANSRPKTGKGVMFTLGKLGGQSQLT